MALVLINPAAGGGRAAGLAGSVEAWLRQRHPQVRCEVPADAQGAAAAVRSAAVGERVVVMGGDGSLHTLLAPLMEGRHEVGLVPVGSGNDGARALGLARLPWRQALAHALQAPACAADVGRVETATETRLFFSSLAAGFDAAVAARALAAPAALRGLPRYLLATLQEVAALQVQPLKIAVDGQAWHEGPALFASTLNTPSYGSGMPAVPHARVDDGRLDLVLAGRFGRLGVLGMLPRLLAGRHLSHPRVRVADAAEVVIEASSAVPVAADGEPMQACTRLCVRVVPGALRVIGK